MDYERLLLSKVAQTQRIETLLLEGIREEHFYDLELRNIFNFLVEHYKKYKKAPSFSTVREEFQLHNFEVTDESVDYLKDKFLKQVKWRFAADSVRDIASLLDDGPEQCGNVEEIFLERSRALVELLPSVSVARLSDLETRFLEYEQPLNGQQGIKMGIPDFDNISFGIQPHEYISVMGRTGIGKSALAQFLMLQAYKQNRTAMYISLEMDARALFRRWDTMLIKDLGYSELKAHTLTDKSKAALRKKAEEMKNKLREDGADILVMDDVRNFTVDRVYAELTRWKPDLCCIDYITQLDTNKQGSNWEKIMHITRILKQTALTLKIPIIGIAQTNRLGFRDEGPDIDDVAGSISIVQDSDIVFGLHQNKDMRREKRMEVRMLKNRDGMTLNADLKWDLENMDIEPWKASHSFV